MPKRVDQIEVRQDVGVYEPVYKTVRLVLWDDGTVTWEKTDG